MERGWRHLVAGLLLIAVPAAGCVGAPAPGAIPAPSAAVAPHGVHPATAALPAAPAVDALLGTLQVPPSRMDLAPVKDRLSQGHAAPLDQRLAACPLETERTERADVHQFWVQFDGCVAAASPVLVGGIPNDPKAEVEVHPGASALRLQFHLDGPEPVSMRVRDADGAVAAEGSDRGDAERDSYFVVDVPSPEPGVWTFRAQLEDLAAARAWTLVAVVTYESNAA